MRLQLARRIVALLFGAVLAVSMIDVGSVVMSRVRVHEDVRAAGQAGATAVQGLPTTPGTASVALRVAKDHALRHGLRLQSNQFLLYAGGTIELSGSRTAPTLLLERIGPLRHLADARSTVTVRPRTFR